MMVGIISQALRHRGIVAVLSVILLLYGTVLAFQSRLDVLPEFVPPQVVVQTESPGLAPEQVESLVTLPVEQALSGIPATAPLRSPSPSGGPSGLRTSWRVPRSTSRPPATTSCSASGKDEKLTVDHGRYRRRDRALIPAD